MSLPVSRSEKVAAVGLSFAFIGMIVGLVLGPRHPTFAVIDMVLAMVGYITFHGALSARLWDRGPVARASDASPVAALWVRVAAILLWLVILPMAALRAYTYLHLAR